MPDRPVAGRSIVTRRAIVDIVRAAVQSSYGVTGFSDPSFGRRLLRWIGLDRPGVQLTTEGGLRLDLFVQVAFGMPVAEVARQVDSAVRYSLRRLVGVEVAGMTIHVDGLGHQPAAVEHVAAPARESGEAIQPARDEAIEIPGLEQAHRTVAQGDLAPGRRRTR
jgi:uncharacterized alkaline shock family protein YloU